MSPLCPVVPSRRPPRDGGDDLFLIIVSIPIFRRKVKTCQNACAAAKCKLFAFFPALFPKDPSVAPHSRTPAPHFRTPAPHSAPKAKGSANGNHSPALFPARPPGAPHFRRPQPLSRGVFRPVVAPDNSPFGHDPPLYFFVKGCYHLIVHTAQPNAFPASTPRPPLSEGRHRRPGARYLPYGGKT